MCLKGVLLVVPMAAGMSTSLALAEPGNGNGNGNGKGPGHEAATITTTVTTTTRPAKVTLCHQTGSPRHPFVKIAVPPNAVWTRVKRGDVLPDAHGSCPIKPKLRS